MGRYLLKRLLLAIITLWILATIVFIIVNVLPGNVGRQILGGFASEKSVQDFNHRIGTDKPLLVQYGRAMRNLFTLDFGKSYSSTAQVTTILGKDLFRSMKLAVLALVITVPLGIFAGRFAAKRKDKLADRSIVMAGLATSSIPEFVTAALLSYLLCIKFHLFHVYADPPDGTSVIGQFRYLFLPAMSMVIVYFGYIARMTRAGVINALDADYTRTATMKGLSNTRVMNRHIMRNALAPTITVIGVQVGYLFGGIVGVEKVFNYHGIGLEMLTAIKNHDIPVLQAAVLVIGIIYMASTLVADLLIAYLNPRVLMEVKR
ncbi:MAG: putative oligopeptide transporter permease protein [Ilumatobacteraceae bacterium]|nr:putative oligopeptide transporter permease protein [Ilumatobacteraceae bacterium]